MSDESSEMRMWDDSQGSRYESRSRGAYYDAAFNSSEHLDRAPLLSEEAYTEVPVQISELASEHCHWRSKEPPSAVPQLVTVLILCAFFMVCELIGGYIAGSLSVMCDAAHMLSDCGGFGLALLAFHLARRKPDSTMSYGYKRAEVLGAMVSVLLIWVLTGVFVYVASCRLYGGDYTIEPDTMMFVSGSGVAFNIVMAIVLHSCGPNVAHHHSHGGLNHGHSDTTHTPEPILPRIKFFRDGREPKNTANGNMLNGDYNLRDFSALSDIDNNVAVSPSHTKNINLRAALIHVIGDLIQSCGVLLASILIKLYPAAKIVDPICTFIFSILVLVTTTRVVRDALSLLMQAVPRDFRYSECIAALSSVSGVRHVHSVHVWALSSHHTIMTAHVAIDELTDPEAVLRLCRTIVRRDFGVQAATLQVERYTDAIRNCSVCLEQPSTRP